MELILPVCFQRFRPAAMLSMLVLPAQRASRFAREHCVPRSREGALVA